MESHREFINRVLGAPKDVSLPILQELLGQGYDMTQWQTSAAAIDAECISKNGNQVPLSEFISGLMHDAPFYELPHGAHIGCNCSVRVTGPNLPDIVVNAFGKQ